ncbi:hypothetical protein [Erysipelothrix inopinata]|uniref:hypothetical protein n=1 Tax=Erysipelothrix inopinata TaxID=225084 RepID=UPI001FE35D1F|nr:hypothetical protein [Erysipelothrix inopinata]
MNYQNTLLKTYRKDIWSKYLKAITDYDLIQPNDAIAVCISGEKTVCCWHYVSKL